MLRSLICSFILLLSPSIAAAQPAEQRSSDVRAQHAAIEVHGRVLDSTRAPVPFARITARRSAERIVAGVGMTDARGDFALRLGPGTYALQITAEGFNEASRSVTIGAAPPELEIVLEVAGLSEHVSVNAPIDSVTRIVSATRTPTPLRDVPQAISVVSRELIADQRMSNMADVVRFMPGVGIAQGEGNRDTPVLRGNASTSDFFVDGVRDDVQYFRDIYNVERVEALKGPNAMIFGRGGAGGVINRVTRQADWRQARELSVQLGSWDNRRLTGDYGAALNETVATRVTGVYENSESYRAGVGVERYGIQPSIALQLGRSTLFRASYEYFHDERTADRGVPSFSGRPVATDPGTFFGDPSQSAVNATVNVLASMLEHAFSATVTLRNRVSYGVYDKFYQNVYPSGVNADATLATLAAYNNATDRTNLFNQTDIVWRPRTGALAHTILAGAEFGRQATDNARTTGYFTSVGANVTSVQVPLSSPTVSIPVTFRPSATDANNDGVATVTAVYAQDQVKLTEWLQAVAGVRFDAFDLDFTDNRSGSTLTSRDRLVSPRLGLIYKPADPLSVYSSYTLTYLPRSGEQLSSLSASNQALEPEEFRNYELGTKWDLTRALTASAAFYRLDRGNVAVPDPVDPTRSLLVDAQRTKGMELELSGYVTPSWTLVGGYAYQDGRITRGISASAQAGAVLAQLPKHSFSLWTKYAFTPRWAAALGVVRRGDLFASTDNNVVVPTFTRVDAGMFFDVNDRLRAQVNIENLFDADYFATAHNNNNITPGSPRAVRFTMTLSR
jgi:catecholate siderophore receptor